METTRIDRWLWAVRLYKTRTAASAACKAGHVRLNGERAKPAGTVKLGDRIEIRGQFERVVEVARVIDERVGAPEAAACLVDHSPPRPPKTEQPLPAYRERGLGRPTKRERRQIERYRGRG